MGRIHPVFHISQLKLYIENYEEFPDRLPPKPEPAWLNQDIPEYTVERILDKKEFYFRGKLRIQYLVKWLGFPDYDATWEPRENLVDEGCENIKLQEFEDGLKARRDVALEREGVM